MSNVIASTFDACTLRFSLSCSHSTAYIKETQCTHIGVHVCVCTHGHACMFVLLNMSVWTLMLGAVIVKLLLKQ